MNLAQIIGALPTDVASTLHTELDAQPFSSSMSKDEVKEIADDAVRLTRIKTDIADDEKRRMVDSLLSMVSEAVVNMVFA